MNDLRAEQRRRARDSERCLATGAAGEVRFRVSPRCTSEIVTRERMDVLLRKAEERGLTGAEKTELAALLLLIETHEQVQSMLAELKALT